MIRYSILPYLLFSTSLQKFILPTIKCILKILKRVSNAEGWQEPSKDVKRSLQGRQLEKETARKRKQQTELD